MKVFKKFTFVLISTFRLFQLDIHLFKIFYFCGIYFIYGLWE